MRLITASSLLLGIAAAGQIEFCNTQSCDGSCSFQSPAGDGTCIQLGGISSAKAIQVDSGCSFTAYTDSNCSNGALTVGLGACIAGESIGSYSYDC